MFLFWARSCRALWCLHKILKTNLTSTYFFKTSLGTTFSREICVKLRICIEIFKRWLSLRDQSLFLAWGRGKDLGLNKVKFNRSALWMLLHWSDPPINIWWLLRPPHPSMSSFSKQIWVVPPLNPSKVFSDPPLLGSQVRLIPPTKSVLSIF